MQLSLQPQVSTKPYLCGTSHHVETMKDILIKEGLIINRGRHFTADMLIKNGHIERIAPNIDVHASIEISAAGKWVMPGLIDDQVHFREPGLTHKADIASESKAAVAGGVTSFMEMPNTRPATLTRELLENKYQRAKQVSLANYSFYMGVSNDNLEEVLHTDPRRVCGLKIFMGSSTGNMLVDDAEVLEAIFSRSPLLIATHCEDEQTIRNNTERHRKQYGEDVPFSCHPKIRSAEACYRSSSLAVSLAKKYNSRLHVLHLTTGRELELFDPDIPLAQKRITAEVCVHHLFFSDEDYPRLGSYIKCNPAIKEPKEREALWQGLHDNRLDVIATDHAPHTLAEKNNTYFKAPSGLPLVQHSLNILLHFYAQGKISLTQIAEKTAHAPAICFNIDKRGYLDEGYWADLVIVNPGEKQIVSRANLHYRCGWSPLEGMSFPGKVETTIVSGQLAYHLGTFSQAAVGKRLEFNR